MKKFLGLDLGTNSIGWALIAIDHENGIVKIIALGSRILPMDAGEIGDFETSGKIKSAAAARTEKRGQRRLNERCLLRRDRLHLALNLLEALPQHYKLEIDFTNEKGEKCGQFKTNKEPKFAYSTKNLGQKVEFLFMDSYEEMLNDINYEGVRNEKGKRIPYDWTLYYLRQKALSKEISLEELAWVLLSYNQKRGYEKLDVEDKSTEENEIVEELDLAVKEVTPTADKEGNNIFKIQLEGNDSFTYSEDSYKQISFKGDMKEVLKVSQTDETGKTDEKKTKFTITDIYELEIEDVKYERTDKGNPHKYSLHFTNGWVHSTEKKKYTSQFNKLKGKSFDYIVTSSFDYKGNFKERSFRAPDYNSETSKDWTLLKKKTEKDALKFNIDKGYKNEDGSAKNYISPKIYSILNNDAKTGERTKIIGGMFQVVEREFYREELKQIIATQREFHNSLKDSALFEKCVKTLYPKNESQAKNLLSNKDTFEHLLVEDILLYQRPLKTKKSEIADCKYEIRHWKELRDKKTGKPIEVVDKETGQSAIIKEAVYRKAVSASHPYFQEFRIWDKLHNLRLIQLERETDGKLSTNVDVTREYFDREVYQALFSIMDNQKSLNQKQFLSFCKFRFKIKDIESYAWNFPEDEELKGNETRVSFATRFKRCGFTEYADFLTQEKEIELWHYLYSVNYKERKENDSKSIQTFFNRFLNGSGISDEIKVKTIDDFTNYPKFASRYCAYSEKALKKLLPFLRMGENRFTGKFDLSVYKADLESISYDKFRISSFIADSNKVGKEAEEKRQSLYEALWKHSINERIDDILNRLSKIDFEADEIDYTVGITNEENSKGGRLPYPKGLFNAFREFKEAVNFTSLDLTKTSYLVYGRHSELAQAIQWKSPDEIRKQLHQELKQHSLNNPVAEKVILEMMQIVAKLWEYYGEKDEGTENYKRLFDEIHVEVGRELKKSLKEKETETTRQKGNRAQNKRIRQVLEEFLASIPYNANSKNSDHFERLKIAEDGAEHRNNLDKNFFEENEELNKSNITKKHIEEILKKSSISKVDFEKYKLWIEQGYRSPYTNLPIKLTDLFDGDKYNIDHVFPQASITNDSLSNKVVCEREVNKLKSDQTGREFVNQPKEREQYCVAHGKNVKIVDDDTYVSIVTSQFSGSKRYILLSKEIPKGFTSSQLNNARHIARKAMELLSHIVREEGEVEFLSKNVLPVSGAVTGKLKEAWRLDQVWKELVAPRFIRMNELTKSSLFGQERVSKSGHKYFDCNLDNIIREKDGSFDIKRIDHRHHALDALIVALCTRDHVNYINNINASAKSPDFGKQRQIEKYRQTLKRKLMFSKPTKENPKEKDWYFMFPGEARQKGAEEATRDTITTMSYFYKDHEANENYKEMVLNALQYTVVTFKQNQRVINNRVNYYQAEPNTKRLKAQEPKTQKDSINSKNKYSWGIRRSLGKDTFYGKRTIDGEEKIVIRKSLDTSFDGNKIKTISDSEGHTKAILTNHLKRFDTIELPFDEAISHYDALFEKAEFESITKSKDNDIKDVNGLIEYLKANKYKFDKADYSKLNVFVEQVSEVIFREEKTVEGKNKYEIDEHPEIAFSPEMIEEMNKPETLKKLAGGKNHTPIRKVRISRGFGSQRALNDEDKDSVKSKQYVVNDAGSNLYLGFYERIYSDDDGNEVRERRFKDIGLIDLIRVLKEDKNNRHNPIDERIFDDDKNVFERIFTLSPLDFVYVPTEEEIEKPSLVQFNNLSMEQMQRVYKYVDGGGGIANFIPYAVSKPIWKFHKDKDKKAIYKSLSRAEKINIGESELIKDEFGLGSQQTKSQNMIDGVTQIKKICWKLQVNRLGIFQKLER